MLLHRHVRAVHHRQGDGSGPQSAGLKGVLADRAVAARVIGFPIVLIGSWLATRPSAQKDDLEDAASV